MLFGRDGFAAERGRDGVVTPGKKVVSLFWKIRKPEIPFSFYMFCQFFLVITSFWILKTLKKGVFYEYYKGHGQLQLFDITMTAAQSELIAKILNAVVVIGFVMQFGLFSRHFRRERLTYLFSALMCVFLIVFSMLLVNPGAFTAWSFYIFGDMYNSVMVTSFFAFLNDSVAPDTAKRAYGPIGVGGLAGGAFGATLVSLNLKGVSLSGWMWICVGIIVLIVCAARLAGKEVANVEPLRRQTTGEEKFRSAKRDCSGFGLVTGSSYLFSILAIVGSYEIISSLLDFQFSSVMERFYSGEEIASRFARVYAFTNWVAFFVQLFLTSYIMVHHGVTTALMVLPAAILTSSIGFMLFPVPFFAAMLNVAENGFNYSINQSAKEALYVPVSTAEKYCGKAFIDMFVQRFAKTVSILLVLVITMLFSRFSMIRWISLPSLALVLFWIRRARHAGKTFSRMSEKTPPVSGLET